jgi:hypothetical protein
MNDDFRIESCPCPTCEQLGNTALTVNGFSVSAEWVLGDLTITIARGDVLRRAVELACWAHPETMKAFKCGTHLAPSSP